MKTYLLKSVRHVFLFLFIFIGLISIVACDGDGDGDKPTPGETNNPPVAVLDAVPVSGNIPLSVQFQGSGSSDPDGDSLTFSWDFGDGTTLTGGMTQSHTYIKAGTYMAVLTVSDNKGESANANIEITALQPSFVAVPDVVGLSRAEAEDTLRDAGLTIGVITSENSDTVSAGLVITQSPIAGESVASGASVNIVVSLGPEPEMVTVPDVVNQPQATAVAGISGAGLAVGSVTNAYSGTVESGNVISQDPAAGTSVIKGSSVNFVVSLGPEMVTVPDLVNQTQAVAGDAITGVGLVIGSVSNAYSETVESGNVISQDPIAGTSVVKGSSVNLVVSLGPEMATVPDVVNQTQAAAGDAITGVGLVIGSVSNAYSETVDPGNVISQDPAAGASVVKGSPVDIVVSLGPEMNLPPDPKTVAPALDRSVATRMFAAVDFLYTGDNPIQTGMDETTINPKQVAVLRGQVKDSAGDPLPGVSISVLDHPEYGSTKTRIDGMFDMAVNGGGTLTLQYEKDGYLTAQRSNTIPWQDFVWMSEVVMVGLDPAVSTLTANAGTLQIAEGSVVSDADGTRQARLMIPAATGAQMVLADGTTQSLSTMNIRATEYTVGVQGPQAMPAELPPNTGYTYCAELTVDEALAAGATRVEFTQAVGYYLENFLEFPVGTILPSGYYDRQRGVWVPSANGRVIKIISISEGAAQIDINGDDGIDTGDALTDIGITPDEQTALGALYAAGTELWRVPIAHFTPWDTNLGFGLPDDGLPPNMPSPDDEDPPCEECEQNGSIIESQSQVLGQRIPIQGTPYHLNYRSDRVAGRHVAFQLNIPLTGDTIPDSLQRVDLIVNVAGQLFEQSFDADTDLSYTFTWDGLDAYGRIVQGRQKAKVSIGYVYQGVYMEAADLAASFSSVSGVPITGSLTREEVTLWQEWQGFIGTWLSLYNGLGGWTLNAQHNYNHMAGVFYDGSGKERKADAVAAAVIGKVAGFGDGLDGDPALTAKLAGPNGIAFGPDGSLFIAEKSSYASVPFTANGVHRITPDGIIETVSIPEDLVGDGVVHLAVKPDGLLVLQGWYEGPGAIIEQHDDGTWTELIPYGSGYCHECPVATARTLTLSALETAPDGTIYFIEPDRNTVRKIDTNNIVTTVVNVDQGEGYNGDDIPAVNAWLNNPRGLALGPDGSLYISDSGNYRVRRVGTDGIITTVAGDGTQCTYPYTECGNGISAVEAQLNSPSDLAIGPDGALYINDYGLRRVGTDGVISWILGDPEYSDAFAYFQSPNGGSAIGTPAAKVRDDVDQMTIGPDGALYFSVMGFIAKIHQSLRGVELDEIVVSSSDGGRLFVFNSQGRHQRTLDALLGITLLEFSYDDDGLIIAVEDRFGNITEIERDGAGNPVAFVAPFGQRTDLALDANGYLTIIQNPAGEAYNFEYQSDGLMLNMKDPKDYLHRFTYYSNGRLHEDIAPDGGIQTIIRSDADVTKGYQVILTSAEGHETRYKIQGRDDGISMSFTTFPWGAVTSGLLKTDGSQTTMFSDGSVSDLSNDPDFRFGMEAPIPSETISQPSGLSTTLNTSRTTILSDAADLLSVSSYTNIYTHCQGQVCTNPRPFEVQFSNTDKTWENNMFLEAPSITVASPEGAQTAELLNTDGQVTQIKYPYVEMESEEEPWSPPECCEMDPEDPEYCGESDLCQEPEPSEPAVLGLDPVDYTYDAYGRLTNISGGGLSLSVAFDASGRLETLTNAAGETTNYGYDAADRITLLTNADSKTIGFGYDANGNMTCLTMPSTAQHNFTYNAHNQVESYTPPDAAGSHAWGYNTDKQLTQWTLPSLRQIDYIYDDGGRLEKIDFDEAWFDAVYLGSSTRISSLTRTSISGLVQNIDYDYDGTLVIEKVFSGVAEGGFSYTYNDYFEIENLSFSSSYGNISLPITYNSDGSRAGYGPFDIRRYGALNFVYSVNDTASSGNLNIEYRYNSLGLPEQRVHTVNGTVIFETTFTYDNVGRLETKSQRYNGGVQEDGYAYVYDAVGRLTRVEKNGVLEENYAYDVNSNRFVPGTSASYDSQDRLTSFGATTYIHDSDGFLNTRGSDTFAYSTAGELISVQIGSETVTYAYDGLGRRVGRTTDGGTTWYRYFYGNPGNMFEITAAIDTSNIPTVYFYDDNGFLIAFERDGNRYYVATDQVGTPLVVTDVDGSVLKQRVYNSFGKKLDDTNSGFDLPIGFAGGIEDTLTGLVRFGFRDYDPEIARWTAKDPVLFSGHQANLYAYAFNDPLNYRDPDGHGPILAYAIYVVGGILVISLVDIAYDNFKEACETFSNVMDNQQSIVDQMKKDGIDYTKQESITRHCNNVRKYEKRRLAGATKLAEELPEKFGACPSMGFGTDPPSLIGSISDALSKVKNAGIDFFRWMTGD